MNEQIKKNYLIIWVIAGAAVLIVTALINRLMWIDIKPPVIEGVFCILIVLIPFLSERVRLVFSGLSATQRKILIILAVLMLAAQIVTIKRMTFPLIPWDMFSRTVYTHEVEFFEYIGITQAGDKVPLRPPVIFKSLGGGRIVTDMDNRMRILLVDRKKAMDSKDKPSSAGQEELSGSAKKLLNKIRYYLRYENELDWRGQAVEINQMLGALGAMYNRQNHQNKLIAVEVIRGALSINDRPHPKTERHVMWHTAIAKDNR